MVIMRKYCGIQKCKPTAYLTPDISNQFRGFDIRSDFISEIDEFAHFLGIAWKISTSFIPGWQELPGWIPITS